MSLRRKIKDDKLEVRAVSLIQHSHLKQPPCNRGDCSRRCQVFTNHRGIAGASLKDAEVGSRKKSNFRRGGNPRRLADVTCRWTNPVYFRVPRGPYQLVP